MLDYYLDYQVGCIPTEQCIHSMDIQVVVKHNTMFSSVPLMVVDIMVPTMVVDIMVPSHTVTVL
jgi:hypothetical protein